MSLPVISKVLDQVASIVEQSALALQQQRTSFNWACAEVEKMHGDMDSCHLLSIGGEAFHTSAASLGRHGPHMLSTIASGAFPTEEDSMGYTFLDRDSHWFALILTYLRGGPLFMPKTPPHQKQVLREMRYYGIPEPKCPWVVFPGVCSGQPSLPHLMMLNIAERQWQSIHLPKELGALCGSGTTLYFTAKMEEEERLSHIDSYDLRSKQFKCVAKVTPPFLGTVSLEYANGHLILLDLFWDVEPRIFRLADQKWLRGCLPAFKTHDYYACSTCVIGSVLYVVGHTYFRCASIPGGPWLPLPPMPTPRRGHTALGWQGKVVVIGGRTLNDGENSAVAEVYDPVTSTWSPLPPMLQPRSRPVAVADKDRIFVVGTPYTAPTATHQSMELYDPKAGKWVATGFALCAPCGLHHALLHL